MRYNTHAIYTGLETGFDVGFYDILKRVADAEDMAMSSIGPKIGKGPNYVNGGITRGSVPSVDNAALMLDACGWTLAAIPRGAVPDNALVIEPPKRDLEAEQRRALERRREQLRRELEETDKLLG